MDDLADVPTLSASDKAKQTKSRKPRKSTAGAASSSTAAAASSGADGAKKKRGRKSKKDEEEAALAAQRKADEDEDEEMLDDDAIDEDEDNAPVAGAGGSDDDEAGADDTEGQDAAAAAASAAARARKLAQKKKAAQAGPSLRDLEAERQRQVLRQLTPAQYNRYLKMTHSSFPKSKMQKLMSSLTNSSVNQNMAIVMSGICKMLVGELVEASRQVQLQELAAHGLLPEGSDAQGVALGPIQPHHLREAWRRYQKEHSVHSTQIGPVVLEKSASGGAADGASSSDSGAGDGESSQSNSQRRALLLERPSTSRSRIRFRRF